MAFERLSARHASIRSQDLAALAVLADDGDRRSIRKIFKASDWGIRFAEEPDEIRDALQSEHVPVLIMDDDRHVPSWRDFLDARRSFHYGSCQKLIVVSRLADERLWAEVLDLGGYDLLAKPLDPEQVVRTVESALSEEGRPFCAAVAD